MKTIIKESDLIKLIKLILEQESDTIEMSPDQYKELLKIVNYNGALITRLKEYRNKKIIITNTLNLDGLPVTSISGITEIQGGLNLNNTQIKDVPPIKIRGYVQYWGTPMKQREIELERRKTLAVADSRREDGEWDDEDSDIGNKAHALLEFLNYSDNVELKTPEDSERLTQLKARLEELENQESEMEGDTTDIVADIEVINDEIEEIEKKADVYNLIPQGGHYHMAIFQLWGTDHDESNEYAVGTETEVEDSAREYVENMIREGEDMFRPDYLQYFIDEDKIRDDAQDDYDYLVRDSPESYFDRSEYELSTKEEEEKEKLEAKIVELEKRKEEWEDYQNNIEDSDSDEYNNAQEQIDQIDEEIENIQEVIDDMEPEGPSEEQIEKKVGELVYDAVSDPVQYLKDRGQNLMDWIDQEKLIDSVLRDDGYGIINGYDGSYDTVEYNGTYYYIMRIG
jgi:predicted  nucleic acid-binding Zn-ribbon protein